MRKTTSTSNTATVALWVSSRGTTTKSRYKTTRMTRLPRWWSVVRSRDNRVVAQATSRKLAQRIVEVLCDDEAERISNTNRSS